MTQLPLPLPLCQRWRSRASSWRRGEGRIDPSRHAVEVVPESIARPFVEVHHYSGTYPAARLAVGLWRSPRRGRLPHVLAGVAVFSVPMQSRVIPSRLGLPAAHGVELGRLVLLDEVEGNGESWMLARAFEALRAQLPEVRGVVSYSDPVERRTEAGAVVTPGHVGVIYQALNGVYLGRGGARHLWLDRWGRVMSDRALSKIRNGEVGMDYACRQLVAMGAPARRMGEEGRVYVARALAEGPFRRIWHPGNHCYAWALVSTGREGRALRKSLVGRGVPYPEGRP